LRFTAGDKKKYHGKWPFKRGLNDMTSLTALLSKWPLIRQIRERGDGTGMEAMSDKTRAMHARIDDAQVARSICPYCGVGCGQLVYHKDGKLISIEGDPESPISQGNLCPKGAASYQLLTHSRRETKVKYRAPRAKKWTEISLDRAMDMVAERVWESRKRTFVHKRESFSPEAWGWSAYPTRRGYDIAARCPVWAPPLAGAELRPHNKISRMRIAF
jgi:formate dehydrogenase major subunit